jgi:hypothetical protein
MVTVATPDFGKKFCPTPTLAPAIIKLLKYKKVDCENIERVEPALL